MLYNTHDNDRQKCRITERGEQNTRRGMRLDSTRRDFDGLEDNCSQEEYREYGPEGGNVVQTFLMVPGGVQNFVRWHFCKSKMATNADRYH